MGLVDFGVAEMMDEQGCASQGGDWRVRSPEAYASARFTASADIYAAAVTLYFLLSGRWPFDQPTHPELEAAITSGSYPALRDVAPHVSKALAQVVKVGMSLDPTARYCSAAAFDTALGMLPARSRSITPLAPHATHLRCWSTVGAGSEMRVCVVASTVQGRVSISTRREASGARVVRFCSECTETELGVRLRRVFDDLR